MPLHPQARQFLDRLEQAAVPPPEEAGPEQARRNFAATVEEAGEPEEVATVTERAVPGGDAGDKDNQVRVRAYRPVDDRKQPVEIPAPALVWFHGGGWVVGDLDTFDSLCRRLANRSGCVVVSVDYRLAPEHRFPAAVDDAYAATRWVGEHAGELGVDPTRLAVGGDSAGGNLAAAVALRARNLGQPSLSFQVLTYPITDHSFDTASYRENGEGYSLTAASMRWYWSTYLGDSGDGTDEQASPLRANRLVDLPPALVQTAEYDPLRDEGEAYAGALREAGVPVTVTRYDGMLHGFLRLGAVFDDAEVAAREIGRALRGAFGG